MELDGKDKSDVDLISSTPKVIIFYVGGITHPEIRVLNLL